MKAHIENRHVRFIAHTPSIKLDNKIHSNVWVTFHTTHKYFNHHKITYNQTSYEMEYGSLKNYDGICAV